MWPLPPPSIWLLVLGVIGNTGFIGLHIAFKLGILQDEQFSLSTDGGFAEGFLDLQLLATCVILGAIWWISRQPTYLLWVAVLGYLLLDDRLRLHERAGSSLSTAIGENGEGVWYAVGEIIPSMLVAVATGGLVWALHRRADEPARATNWLMLGVMVAFAGFGIGVDLLHTAVAESGPRLVSGLLGVLEDGGEMFVATVALVIAVSLFSRSRAGAARHDRTPHAS